ncbi:hypothetical protein WA026_018290 [Henosepilachna vigintioctopunctata]|uniref:CLIP domain-containing serine protease n=1 Tax=Henosepilachna vigintioctopunctata TaxID=420089 RepID=A0AAW1VF84_9CUCU
MKWVILEKCFSLAFIVLVFVVDQCLGAQYNTFTSKRATFCPPNTACQPLSTCPILSNILSNECVLRNQIDNLSCGYQGSGLICCPSISGTDKSFTDRSFNDRSFNDRSYTPGKSVDGLSCGVSQILGIITTE